MHNLHGTRPTPSEDSDDDEEDEEDEEERKPQLELAMVPHYGGINRVRVQSSQKLVNHSLQHTPPQYSNVSHHFLLSLSSSHPPTPLIFRGFVSLYELINR